MEKEKEKKKKKKFRREDGTTRKMVQTVISNDSDHGIR
jgi:hypothetical protein